MKTNKILFGIIILFSCENPVRFEVPQPEGKSDETQIPRALIGQYRNAKDSSLLIVRSNLISKRVIADFSEHKSQLNSSDRAIYQNDTVFSQIDFNMRVDAHGDPMMK
jgi:hypothetical protein